MPSKKDVKTLLNKVVGKDLAQEIFTANFNYSPPKDYVKGEVMTVKEFKSLLHGAVFHLLYYDEDGQLRENGFQELLKQKDLNNMTTKDGYSMPLDGHKPSEKIEKFDNSGWTFTVRFAVPKKKK